MRQLNARLSSGELDEVDPMRRLWHGLAPGELHGDRELAQLNAQIERYRDEDESDPKAALAWMKWREEHGSYHGGPQ